MATMIRPNRMEVSDRFPVLGFTVKTDAAPWFEVALATEPALLRPEGKDRRTKANFYSSHAEGPLSAERGEAVYLVPQEALQRFAGQPKLYYGVATFADANRGAIANLRIPNEDSPWVDISSFSGRGSRRRQIMVGIRPAYGENGNGYNTGTNGVLEWAGDSAAPGAVAIAGQPAGSTPINGNGPIKEPTVSAPAPANGNGQPALKTAAAPETAASAAFGYDDGFGPMPQSPVLSEGQALQSTAMSITNITHAGNYRLAYDRLKNPGQYIIEPEPGRSKRNFRGQPQLQTALNNWAPYITRVENAPAYILTGGLYRANKPGQHGAGLAIDIDGLWWSDTNNFFAKDAQTDWVRYLRLEATLRKVFGTVLNYDYNAAHHDHWHCDLGRSTNWRRVESQAKFGQRVLNEIFGKNLTIDGDWGTLSQADSVSIGYDFTKDGEWDRFLDNLIQGVSAAQSFSGGDVHPSQTSAAQAFAASGHAPVRALDIVDPFYQPTDFLDALKSWYEWGKKYSRWHAGVSDTTFFPHSAICQFQITFPDTPPDIIGVGTGFYIAQDKILTCAHNVIERATGAKAEKIKITPGMNGAGTPPFGSFTVQTSALEPHPQYLTHTGDKFDFDMAVIHVSTPPPNGWYFDLEPLNMSIPEPIIVGGYPARSRRFKNIVLDWRKQRLDADTIQGLSDNMERFQYNLQTLAGNSGSPVYYVYTYDDQERQQCVLAVSAIGVHVSSVAGDTTLNQGCRLTEDKINWIRSAGNSSSAGAQVFAANKNIVPGSGVTPVDKSWANVPFIDDANGGASWSEAAAMIVGWRDSMSVNPSRLGNGRDRASVATDAQLVLENHAAYNLMELCQMLETHGPLWMAPKNASHPHAVVITGICGDGTEDGTFVFFNDPWGAVWGTAADSPGGPTSNPTPGAGSRYSMKFRTLAAQFDPRPGGNPANATHIDVQLMHPASAKGRDMTKIDCSESGSYGMAAAQSGSGTCVTGARPPQSFASHQSFYMNESQRTCRANTPDLAAGQGVAKSLQAVEIASAIAGATMSRILDNESDVHWELDQLQGLKHIGDNAANAGSASYKTTTLNIAGPIASTVLGFDKIYADCEVVFQHNGRSLGNIQVSVVRNSDAVGGSLTVKENIMNDANTYTTVPASSARFAAIKLRFHYRFGWTWPHDDWIAITDVTLYSNGAYDIRRRWTQK